VYGADDSSFSVTSKTGSGHAGTLVIGLNLADVGRAVDALTITILRVSSLAALLAAAAAAGIVRLLLRPVTQTAHGRQTAHDVAGRTAVAVVEVCRQMRRPLSVLAGLAEYYRGRGALAYDEAGRMMRQVAAEAGRMAALVDELEATARDDPRPGDPAPSTPRAARRPPGAPAHRQEAKSVGPTGRDTAG